MNLPVHLSRPVLTFANLCLTFMPKPIFSNARVRVTRHTINSDAGGKLRALLYSPRKLPKEPSPCLVYFHGGAFALKASPYHYALARQYALRTPCKVLFVNYRLAPKHRFPTPARDCFSAFRWVCENAQALGIDPKRVAVGGDSAGGDLAAAVTLMARDAGAQKPCYQMLLYPVIDRRMKTESMKKYVDTPLWDARLSKDMWALYLSADTSDIAYASPIEAPDLSGLPDAYIESAEFDCLRDEAAEYAQALRSFGATVELRETKGTVHGYEIVYFSPIVKRSIIYRSRALRSAFKEKKD